MVSQARSQQLIAFQSTGAQYSPAFVAPAGHVVLGKAAHVTNTTGAAIRVVLSAVNASPSLQANLFDLQLAAGTSYYWPGWAALDPGNYFVAFSGAAGVVWWISGAVLNGPPPFPIAGISALILPVDELPNPPPGVPRPYPPAGVA